MPRTLAILFVAASVGPALAAPPSFTTQMTCAQARGVVAQRGSVLLYESPHVYDRYVSNRGYCLVSQVTQPAFVRTLDMATCPVGSTCVEPDRDQDFDR